jgi:hypothetical protein
MIRFFGSHREERSEEYETKKVIESTEPSYEVPVSKWKPIEVRETLPRKILFVDGVRRTEYRVTIFNENSFLGEGIFISLGAGLAEVDFSKGGSPEYRCINPKIVRFFIHNSEENNLPSEWKLKIGNTKVVYKTLKSLDREVSLFANVVLRKLEAEVSIPYLKENAFILMDGTVKFSKFYPNLAYLIKDSTYFYLPKGQEKILLELKRGERTPVFLFEEKTKAFNKKTGKIEERKVKKLGCYVKIDGQTSPGTYDPLTSLVRIELPFYDEPKEVRKTVEKAASVALHFANNNLRDRRSPQNLTAIAYLEKELRRYLGNYKILRREIGRVLSSFRFM